MLAARGVSLGLGKINLSELNQLPATDRATLGRIARAKKKKELMKPRIIVKKRVDKKTLFQACKAVFFGSLFIAAGLAMTVLGYFNRELATTVIYNSALQSDISEINDSKRTLFKGMQYVGPVCMGFGAFAMIIACVMTLESRDRHAQIIQEESTEYRKLKNQADKEAAKAKSSLLSPFEETVEIIDEAAGNKKTRIGEEIAVPKLISFPNGHSTLSSEKSISLPVNSPHHHPLYKPATLSASASPIELSVHRFLNVNIRKPRGFAPICHAEADSFLDLTVQTPNVYISNSTQKRLSVKSLVESSQ
jgi:hypothetical protein